MSVRSAARKPALPTPIRSVSWRWSRAHRRHEPSCVTRAMVRYKPWERLNTRRCTPRWIRYKAWRAKRSWIFCAALTASRVPQTRACRKSPPVWPACMSWFWWRQPTVRWRRMFARWCVCRLACRWNKTVNASAAPAAAAVVLAMTTSWPTSMAKSALMRGRKKPCVWRWSICLRSLRQRVRCLLCSERAGRACCCTKQ